MHDVFPLTILPLPLRLIIRLSKTPVNLDQDFSNALGPLFASLFQQQKPRVNDEVMTCPVQQPRPGLGTSHRPVLEHRPDRPVC